MKHARIKVSLCIALAGAALVAPMTWAEPTMTELPKYGVGSRYVRTIDKRIINGVAAKQGDLPWQVALFITDPNDNATYLCGGSVIASGWVLTAAHCIENARDDAANVTVLSGRVDLNDPKMTSASASEIIVHGSWNRTTMENDIALVKATIDPKATPIKYISETDDVPVISGGELTVSGFGVTGSAGQTSDVLLKANVRFVAYSSCQGSQSYGSDLDEDTMFCAGSKPGDGAPKDSCQGDSGGPIVRIDAAKKTATQVGIVSWGKGCAKPQYPGVYTRLSRYAAWIKAKAGV